MLTLLSVGLNIRKKLQHVQRSIKLKKNYEKNNIAKTKNGRTVSKVRYASIFAKKYGPLVRYAFFVMVRYVGTLFELAY